MVQVVGTLPDTAAEARLAEMLGCAAPTYQSARHDMANAVRESDCDVDMLKVQYRPLHCNCRGGCSSGQAAQCCPYRGPVRYFMSLCNTICSEFAP